MAAAKPKSKSKASNNSEADLRYAADPPNFRPDRKLLREMLVQINHDLPLRDRPAEALRLAEQLFAKTGSWVVFFRTMFAADGVVAKLFPTDEDREVFHVSKQHLELLEMVAALRSQDGDKLDAMEPPRMITIRMPRSVHAVLQAEAQSLKLSMNQLCMTKLLQRTDSRNVPEYTGNPRGRRPGPQKLPSTQKTVGPKKAKAAAKAKPTRPAKENPKAKSGSAGK